MIIVITGPTGVGKTKLSIALAKTYNAEIINADSMQIYKDLNIGTAKIKESEKEGIVHHLFDIKTVYEDYSIYEYQKEARIIIDDILKRGKNAIIVGGTGLYIKSCLYDYKLGDNIITNTYDDVTTEDLYLELKKLDQDIKIDKNNRKRVVRALNYYKENNKSISLNKNGDKLLYDAIFIGLTTKRDKLYEIINKRVDHMIYQGLIEEAKSFYDKKVYTKPLINGIGYKELYSYFDGVITKDEAIDLIKKNSRHYAKRQYTFFNNKLNINWFDVNFNDFNQTILEVINFINSKNN